MSEKTILLVEDDRDQVTLALRKHGILDEVVSGEGSYAGRQRVLPGDTIPMPARYHGSAPF
ncbi:MAG TPA: hypothetical protein VFV45_03640 [Rubrobacteraceae bacterium]|jgi:hypothetical protein|nr:hypothetical protein [Rubrobacteraceae bacterium]